jgi:hypothetical protein
MADTSAVETRRERHAKFFARFSNRRDVFRALRRQTRHIVLLMALMEALRVGPAQIVLAGKDGYPPRGEDDFGISYWIGYFLAWIYMCVFMVIWMPLFSVRIPPFSQPDDTNILQWWVPNVPAEDTKSGKTISKAMDVIKRFDLFILPVAVGLCLATHICYLLQTLVHPDSNGAFFRKPDGSKKAWAARLLQIAGILLSLSGGYYVFCCLEMTGLARVKNVEYAVIVMPIQINIGLMIGTAMQWRMERRIEKKQRLARENGEDEEAQPMLGEKEVEIEA